MSIISYNDIYTVYAWQENNRTFTVTTNEGGIKHIRLILKDKQTALNVSGEEVSIYYAATKPNNKEVLVSASKIDAENGVIEFPIEPALTTNPGMVNGEIRVIAPLGVLKFYGINLKVHKGVSDKAAEQAEAYTALVEALRKVSALLASSTIAPLDDINEFDTGDKGRLNPVASGTLYEILQRYVKNDFTIAGLDLSKPITSANLREALLMNKFHFSVGKPTTSTKGRQGDFCYDTSREKLYLCIQAINGVYTWKNISEFIDISDVLQSYVLNTIKIAGLSLNKDIEAEELAEALNHYPFIVLTDTPTTSTKGKVGQFGGLISYNASSRSYTVKLFLCCSAGKTEGTYQWMLINSNTISDEQIKSALDEYLTKNPISGTGADGEDGVGIEATEINNDGELVVTYTDGKVENVGIVVGVDGKDGENGVNGITPHIGDNGNWYVGDTDTGKPSQGQDGENGKDGNDGQDGYSPTISVSPTETGYMLTIDHNENFQENVFIENGADGEKGEKGDTGAQGPQGEKGADGYTPVKGVDYYTEEDKAEIESYIDERLSENNQSQEIFTDVLAEVGYTENSRVNSSGNVVSWDNSDVTGYIPVKAGDVVRLKDMYVPDTYNETGNSYGQTAYAYTSDKTFLKSVFLCTVNDASLEALDRVVENGGVVQFTVAAEVFGENVAYIIIGAAEITAESEVYVNSTIVNSNSGDIPAYWLSELTSKSEIIQKAVVSAGRNKSAFLWYTDAHWQTNSKISPYLLDYLCKNTPINKVNFGGDIINDPTEFTYENIKYAYEWRKLIAGLPNHHSVIGNHDANHNQTDVSKIAYSFLNAPEESSNMIVGGDFYYYIDNPSEKTRYLYLSYLTNNHTEMMAQGQFIVDAIKSAPENWHIVAIAHRWFQYTSSSSPTVGSTPAYESEILKIFDEYNARTTHTASNYFTSQDFADGKAKVEFCIGGHIHIDYDFRTDGGIPVIITTSDTNQDRVPDSSVDSGTLGTISESAVYGIVADYDNSTIKVIGVGRGTSREISISV